MNTSTRQHNPPPNAGERTGDEEKKQHLEKWAKVRGCKTLLGKWRTFKDNHDQDFNPTEAHVSRHGVSAVGLLSVLNEEHFTRLSQTWNALYNHWVKPEAFQQLFRTLFAYTELFNSDGMFVGGPGSAQAALPPREKVGMTDLDYYIKELFVVVDVEKHGMVTWEDFVNFLISSVMVDADTNKRLSDSSYVLENTIVVGSSRKAEFTSMKLYPNWNKLAAIAKKQVAVIDCADLSMQHPAKLLDHDANVLATAYNNVTKHFVTACSDFKIRVWSSASSMSVVKEFHLPVSAKSLGFSSTGNTMYVGDREGYFHAIDFEGFMQARQHALQPLTNQQVFVKYQQKIHSNTITDLISLPNHNVVTVGLDGKVQLINPSRNFLVTPFGSKVKHAHGVFSVQHAESYHFLITTGLENYALIWVDNMPNIPSFKLSDPTSPHAAPLCGVCVIPNTPHIMTIDTIGVTKVFDIRSSQMLDSFNMKCLVGQSEQDLRVHCCVHTGSRNRQLVYGAKGLYVFEHESKSSDIPRMAHSPDQQLYACSHLPSEETFVSVSSKEIRLWRQNSGIVEKTYTPATQTHITAALVDIRNPPKVVLGHADGKVTVANAITGHAIRSYQRHTSAVVRIALDTVNNRIATAGQGGMMFLWHDLDPPRTMKCVPKAKKVIYSTFEDEVQVSQNPLAAFGNLLMKKKEGEMSDAAMAAANKMKATLAATLTAKTFANAPKNATDLTFSSQKQKRQMPLAPTKGSDPLAKVTLPGEVTSISFSNPSAKMLVTIPGRTAFVYVITEEKGIARVANELLHLNDTELTWGDLHTDDYCFTSDTAGIVHFWCLKFPKGICLSRWYTCDPPRAPSRFKNSMSRCAREGGRYQNTQHTGHTRVRRSESVIRRRTS